MEAYLDNSATTRCLESVRDIVAETMMNDFGNPSSRHLKGVTAEKYLRDAREEIARTLKVNEKEIYFTSGGTESDNWAVIGAAMANKRAGMHVITTSVEHAAVLQPFAYLEEQGFRVTYLPVDAYGSIDLKALEEAVCEETILVSIMYVNNELGTLEPVGEAAAAIRKKNAKTLLHVDAIQAYGKYRIYPKRLGIDMLSVSGHKIHGPKGSGFLYVNEKVKIKPLILGGGQQKGMRSGTDNVPGIAGIGVAAREAYRNFDEKMAHLRALKAQFIAGVVAIPDVTLQGQSRKLVEDIMRREEGALDTEAIRREERVLDAEAIRREMERLLEQETQRYGAPHIISVSFKGVRSEVLLHALEEKGIYVSSGSACSSNKKLPVSSVLKEAGVERELLESTVRFSFSTYTTEEEINYCLQELAQIVPMLRKYMRH